MEAFKMDIQLRWSDLDPNLHLRHSVYYDWGALCRITCLEKYQLTAASMNQLRIGPILFREECVFRKEIRSGDQITIDMTLLKANRNFSRLSIVHTIRKNGETVAAVLTVDMAWLNTSERKLAIPPVDVQQIFHKMPVAENFQWAD